MDIPEFLSSQWLLIPLAVFGFLSSLWLLAIVCVNLGRDKAAASEERVIRTWIGGKEIEMRVPKARRAVEGPFGALFSRSGTKGSPKAFITQGTMLVGLVFVFALLWSRSLLIAVAVLALIASLLIVMLRVRAARRRALMEQQCVDSLKLASRSLRAGHPISGVIKVLAERVPAPTGNEFIQIAQRESMGESLDDAIRNVLLRSETLELRAFGTALLVQMQAGGNLTQTIDRLCDSILERMVLRRRGRALTAEARLSGKIVIATPFISVFIFSTYSERYSEFIFGDPLGRLFLVGSLLLLLGGMLAVNRFSRIDRQYDEVVT